MIKFIVKEIRNVIEKVVMIVTEEIRNVTMYSELFFINCEYEKNISAIYKGSIRESFMKFRFRERFRKKDGVFWCDGSRLCMEAI